MPDVVFVMSERQDSSLRELASTLQYELGLQGVRADLQLGRFAQERPELVHVLLDPVGYTRAEGPGALPDDRVLRRTIFLSTEPPPSAGDEDQLELLGRAGALFGSDQRWVIALQRLGIQARFLRPGYSKALDRFDPEAPRPIDVLCLDARDERQAKYVADTGRALSRYRCALGAADSAAAGSSPSPEGRWSLLQEAKVVIKLHAEGQSRFAWREALDAIHAGAVVISEHSSGLAPLVPGEHLFVASPDSLPYVTEAALRDERRLERIRVQAYERLSTWIPYGLSVAVLRAAIVELVGEPMPSAPSISG